MNTTLRFSSAAVAPMACLAALLLAAAPAISQGFVAGDVYLQTPALSGISSGQGGIVRVDPVTGSTTAIRSSIFFPSLPGLMAYDPYRGGLIVCGNIGAVLDPVDTWVLDSAGNAQSLGQAGSSLHVFAPTGDGRIYCHVSGTPNSQVQYLDANNQRHDLLDASGSQPFRFVPTNTLSIRRMLYHAPTNSLIAAGRNGSPTCAGAASGNSSMAVFRVALSVDGTRVAGPVVCGEFDVSPSGEDPVGLSLLPDGDVLIVADTNSGATEPRIVRLDPDTMAMTAFASPGGAGAPALIGGTWSSRIGRALLLDSGNDVLRSYLEGTSGPGTEIPPIGVPVSSPGSSGELVSLIEVGQRDCAGSFETYGSATAGSGGFTPSLTGTGCPENGEVLEIHASSCLGGAAAVLLVGAGRTNFPFLGGSVLVVPFASVPLAALGGLVGNPGEGSLTLPLTAGDPATFDLQLLVLDAGAVQGLAFSGGLEIVVAP